MKTEKIDTAISAEAYNLNDTVSRAYQEVVNMQAELKKTQSQLSAVIGIGRCIDKIGGAMPYAVRAALDAAFDVTDPVCTDAAFAEHLVRVAKRNPDPLRRSLAYLSDVGRCAKRIAAVDHRISKLTERIRSQKDRSSAERKTAIDMRLTANRARDVIVARMQREMELLFAARNQVLNGIADMNGAICSLFPQGSAELRAAYNAANGREAVLRISSSDERIAMGESGNRKTVRI